MQVRIIDRQPLGQGGGIEFGVSGNQRQRRVGGMDFEDGRELHGIRATQAVPAGQRGSLGDQSGRYFDDAILVGEIDLEIRQGGRGIVGRDRAAA
jgi:hypothetical protein